MKFNNYQKKKLLDFSWWIILVIMIMGYIFYDKAQKQEFVRECPYCHSKNITHNKLIYKYTENFVIPLSNVGVRGEISNGIISKPIAHFDVKYYCHDCNKTFNKELEIDLLLEKNQDKFKIEYKSEK